MDQPLAVFKSIGVGRIVNSLRAIGAAAGRAEVRRELENPDMELVPALYSPLSHEKLLPESKNWTSRKSFAKENQESTNAQ